MSLSTRESKLYETATESSMAAASSSPTSRDTNCSNREMKPNTLEVVGALSYTCRQTQTLYNITEAYIQLNKLHMQYK